MIVSAQHNLQRGSALEVFLAFLKLGLTAFGGPIAHLGYFRDAFVKRRGWLDDARYGELLALCQFLPGPASSQMGFALGLMRAGRAGGLAAWAGFTLPSAALMTAFAFADLSWMGAAGVGLIHGLKLVAVAVVAAAVIGMARTLWRDAPTIAIGLAATALALLVSGSWGQLGAIALGAVAGVALCRGGARGSAEPFAAPVSRGAGLACLALFAALLIALPLLAAASAQPAAMLADSFYRSGALVFGGGHVVLPLLEAEMVTTGAIDADRFLAGYGAAQAVPGPLFTFAAYLGAANTTPANGIGGAALALVAIFLPGLLLVAGALPFWSRIRATRFGPAAIAGANAAVVGLLAAALYDPVATSAIRGVADGAVAVAALSALMLRAPVWAVVLGTALCGVGLEYA